MQTKHTPGPWTFDQAWSLILGPNGGEEQVCAIHGSALVPKQQAQANAKLIAAAPDLLEACYALADALMTPSHPELVKPALDLARNAINKATS